MHLDSSGIREDKTKSIHKLFVEYRNIRVVIYTEITRVLLLSRLVGEIVSALKYASHQHTSTLRRGHAGIPAMDIDSLHLTRLGEMAAYFGFEHGTIEGMFLAHKQRLRCVYCRQARSRIEDNISV